MVTSAFTAFEAELARPLLPTHRRESRYSSKLLPGRLPEGRSTERSTPGRRPRATRYTGLPSAFPLMSHNAISSAPHSVDHRAAPPVHAGFPTIHPGPPQRGDVRRVGADQDIAQ